MLLLPSSSVPLWSVRLRQCSKAGLRAALDGARASVTGLAVRATLDGEPHPIGHAAPVERGRGLRDDLLLAP
ncbi:hypothetical protein [Streptomyces sp. cg40]|uniref:hypothetical protein n=1 Tax=Streptomyces sp. cg40 TaxID=3419764 RepID=UPI003D06203C